MQVQNPLALLLLILLVPIVRIGRPGRGYGRGRETAALVLRCILLILLTLAAAGLELRRGSDALAVVFLVDGSDSMTPASEAAARDFIERSLAEMGPDDQAAVIVFGGDALVDRPLSADRSLARFTSIPNTTQTDLAEAIRLAMALYPPEAARRMVLLTDGQQTTGDALAAAELAALSGAEFLVLPLQETSAGQEIILLSVDLPSRLIEGEAFDLTLTVHARDPEPAIVRIFAAGGLVFEGAAELESGTQSFRIPLVAGEPGFTPYVVLIGSADDSFSQNNRLAAFTEITGPPKVLLVAPPEGEPMPFSEESRPDETSALRTALESAGFTVDQVPPSGLPFELALLSEYASVVLVDVPARELSNRQMDALQSYVRDLAGGLLVVGGPTAYGVGGYFRTTLEEILPIDMEIKDQERRPTLTMVFIIDHSGSMGETNSGVTKLDLAKEAAIRSVELLFPGDKVGVIAFDDTASWVVPITELDDPAAVMAAIRTIGIGGGTDIMAGLQAMAQALPQDDALVKHVILLTDGGADATGIPELVEGLFREYGITLTTVGVGSDAAPFLQQIAVLGGGRYHFTDRPESIPSIFTEETTLATRAYIVEETFFPALAGRSPILNQISEVPPLHGYVAASAKDTAQTILVSHQGDPILASWQYGLGRVVAWTSDATSRWARDWVTWEGFPTFWTQAVRYTVSERSTSPLQIRIEADGEKAFITIEAVTDSGDYLNNYAFTANLVAPDGSVQPLALPQTAPGQYQAAFEPTLEGAYLLRFDGIDPTGGEGVSELAGWVLSYSPEYRFLQETPGFLEELAGVAGGQVIGPDQRALVFARPEQRAAAALPLWPLLLTAALILLPFDIAVRRLVVEKADLVRAWGRLRGRLRPAPAATGAASAERMSSLLQAKERVEERRKAPPQREAPPPERRAPTVQTGEAPAPPPAQAAPPKPAPPRTAPPPEPKAPTETQPEQPPDQSTTSALLARKRARERKNKE